MSDFEEGADFEGQFHKLFATGNFASSEETEQRLKRERKAGQTPKQRRKKSVPKKQINFRATAETEALIKKLAGHLDKSVTDVIALAVEALAKSELGSRA
jgi:hypothetical protein